ncbi:MAG TPA: Gldg family protein [Acidobacteriota bacterium]|nr:Gldg family protein [Acidobacteriota bacterium]
MQKSLRKSLSSLTAVPFLIAVVVAVNLLGLFFFTRFDLTDARLYSLSEASKRLAGSLDDPVIIKLYFSEDLPAPYNANARYLKDQLYEYRAYSGDRVRFEFIDPIQTDREEEAMGLGIPPMQIQVLEKDKVELKKVYMGLVFLYEDRREVIPVVQSTRNLEYELSSAIRKVTTVELPTVGFLSGHGESGLYTNLQTVRQALEQLYYVRTITLSPGNLIDETISTLVIVGPTDSIPAWDQYAIDQFLMRNGKLAVCYDPVAADLQEQTATNRSLNWGEFLAHYGIRVNENLIIDAQCSQIAVTQQQGFIRFQNLVQFPYMPEVRTFNPDNLVSKDLEVVSFLFISPVDSTLADSLGLALQPLCWSSERSGIRRAPYYISLMQESVPEDFDQPPQVLGAAITGVFRSAFPGGPPVDPAVDRASLPDPMPAGMPGRLVVMGDADFCSDQGIRGGSNLTFFMNIVDWLTQDESLITIRSREVTSRPLAEVSDGQRRLIKYANIFGPSVLIVLLGVWRWQVRRRTKRS